MSRKTYFKDETFSISYEIIDGYLFIHAVFDEFNKTVLSKVKEVWVDFIVDAFFDGFEEIFTYTKDPRIVNIIGGAQDITDEKVSELGLRMYKWELK